MEKHTTLPPFNMLGYNIQSVVYNRLGDEKLKKLNISIVSKQYEEKLKIYSLQISMKFELDKSKENEVIVLGGFKINDEKILEKENNIVSIFAASLFPYVRSTIQSLSSDEREPIKIPTLDLRYLDLTHGISLERE